MSETVKKTCPFHPEETCYVDDELRAQVEKFRMGIEPNQILLKEQALKSLINVRDDLKACGLDTDLSEKIGLDNGGLVITLQVKGLSITEANFLVKQALGLEERA